MGGRGAGFYPAGRGKSRLTKQPLDSMGGVQRRQVLERELDSLEKRLERLAPYAGANLPEYDNPRKREQYYETLSEYQETRKAVNELLRQEAAQRSASRPRGQTFDSAHHEVVRTVFGFNVYRPKNTQKDYRVDTGYNQYRTFSSQKAAVAYIESEVKKDRPKLFGADPGREITSSTYKRAQKRLTKQINDRFKNR